MSPFGVPFRLVVHHRWLEKWRNAGNSTARNTPQTICNATRMVAYAGVIYLYLCNSAAASLGTNNDRRTYGMHSVASAGNARITLIGKPGCHLCDEAREVVARVAERLGVGWVELNMLDDPDLAARYVNDIPVVLVDGVVHDFWRVSEQRLVAALTR